MQVHSAELTPGAQAEVIEPVGPSAGLDDPYQRAYERFPEDPADLQALLPHLPLPAEDWA